MLAVLAGAAGAGVAAHVAPALAPVAPGLAKLLRVPLRVAHPRGVAITFDDGPHREGTPAALDALARAGARATFFLVGEQVERLPSLAAEIVAAGHEVALHGQRHRNQLRLTPAAIAEDLRRGAAAIEDATGGCSALYRPPYGIFSAPGLAIVRRQGRTPLLWSKWGRDWTRRATPASIAALALDDLGAGDVVLLHDADHYSAPDSWRRTVAALPRVLDEVAARGLVCVRAGDAVGG
ncbi:MAG: peptidoglycan-N-acetylglucosamine deacetylase [Solirubrobacteraceae bacterium]|nr:peptidoglycan-N-acetylglucosamine deacetylase [Solirubrobacteraceae bacterium]